MPNLEGDGLVAARAVRKAIGARREHWLALVRQQGGTQVDAEEIRQAAAQRALERSGQVRDPARAEAWVGRVVHNILMDELRKRREPIVPLEELELEPDGLQGAHFDCGCVLVQIEELKPEYATILRRVIVVGLSLTEVAGALGLTVNNATVRLHRARVALRAQLAAHCDVGTTCAHGDA